MASPPVLNALVPFSTRLADDGLVHVRAWDGPHGPVAIVAELDWALLVDDPSDAYYGPGIVTYPAYALGAAAAALRSAGMQDARIMVRLPDPPGERILEVTDPDDPLGWPQMGPDALAEALRGCDATGPPPGAYIRRVVEAWVAADGSPG